MAALDLADGDPGPEAHEFRFQTGLEQAVADIIIFRQAVGIEGLVVALLAQQLDAPAREGGRDTGRGDEARHRRARDQILAMPFGELVHIVTRHQLIPFARHREHRQLHHVGAVEIGIDHLEGQRVDDVLGILHREGVVMHAHLLLMREDVLDHPVEAIGLRGRAGMADHGAHDLLVLARNAVNLGDGVGVIGVAADENVVMAVFQRGQRIHQHARDDIAFLPGRHHDGEALFRRFHDRLGRRHEAEGPRQDALALQHPEIQVEEGVIGRGDEDGDGGIDRRPAQAGPVEARHCGAIQPQRPVGDRQPAIRPESLDCREYFAPALHDLKPRP